MDPLPEESRPTSQREELDEGPYGLRGKHTPALQSMMGAYLIIFGVVILVPLVLFILIRFLIL
jgi:hypothetical protein